TFESLQEHLIHTASFLQQNSKQFYLVAIYQDNPLSKCFDFYSQENKTNTNDTFKSNLLETEKNCCSQAWYYVPLIPTLRTQRQVICIPGSRGLQR
ncbi:mCG1037755, partial [Mus musculus]